VEHEDGKMTDASRIQSFSDFWMYYIGEHRHPVCRMMHFVGTGGFVFVLSLALMANPVRMGSCLLGGLIVGVLARRIEAKRMAGREVMAIVVLWMIGSPWVFAGIFWAYLWAWVGHFKIEMNRPATFQYPLWSLFGDFKMVSLMVCGQLWSGDPTVTG
jgi:hypothetical protein